MKRDFALVPLSREHLSGLMLAACLKNGVSSNPRYPWPCEASQQREKVLQMWQQELRWHFEAEERYLFEPLQPLLSEPSQQLSLQLWAEHKQIETIMAELPMLSARSLEKSLEGLGYLLEAHIRCEERLYFECLQQEILPARLQSAGEQLAAFYAQREPFQCIFTGRLRQAGT